MRNRKNIVLMFLIVMLSFAIVSEVSAVAPDDAEVGESGLNVPVGSFNSTGFEIPSERFHEVSPEPVDDAIDTQHSNINQTSLRDVSHETSKNKNLYEQTPSDDEGMPLEQNNHMDDQIPQNNIPGEKMDNLSKIDFNDLRFGENDTGKIMDNDFSEVSDKITSELIGIDNLSVALKNNRKNSQDILPEFNGVLPQEFERNIIFDENISFNDMKGDLIQFDKDLQLNNSDKFLSNKNISLLKNELPIINDTINGVSKNTHFPKKDISPLLFNSFLPKKDIMPNFKHDDFNNTREMPDSNHPNFEKSI